MPIEDPTVEWSEDASPFETVAKISVKAQDGWEGARIRKIDEAMRFGVWTGLEAHRPLGGINRARREPYERSAAHRGRVNGCPIHEPVWGDVLA